MMSLVSVLGCGTWFFLIEEQLYYLAHVQGGVVRSSEFCPVVPP
jgi:hypothetical protein